MIVGESQTLGSAPIAPARSAFARPKSSTFTVPSARTLMLAGFRSRWTMPCSCAASSASAICLRDRRALRRAAARPRRDAVGERLALDELHHERVHAARFLEAVDLRDVGMIERREHLRFALRSAPAARRSAANDVRQDLQRDVAIAASCRARGRPRPCRPRRAVR